MVVVEVSGKTSHVLLARLWCARIGPRGSGGSSGAQAGARLHALGSVAQRSDMAVNRANRPTCGTRVKREGGPVDEQVLRAIDATPGDGSAGRSILMATLTDIALRPAACDRIEYEDPFRMGSKARHAADSTDEGGRRLLGLAHLAWLSRGKELQKSKRKSRVIRERAKVRQQMPIGGEHDGHAGKAL